MEESTYKMSDVRAKLFEIISKVVSGQDVVITKMNIPIVKVVKIDK